MQRFTNKRRRKIAGDIKRKIFRVVFSVLFLGFLLVACSTPAAQVEDGETTTPTMVSEAGAAFTIQAEENLRAPLSALYTRFTEGEDPVFVESGADIQAVNGYEMNTNRPEIPATFLENAVLIPLTESRPAADFITFAISADGQQALIDGGFLPTAVTITDQAGKEVTIQQPVRRVISSYGPTTGFVYNVGAEDRLVSASYLGARDPMGASVMEKIDPRFPGIMGDEQFSQSEFNIEEAAILNPDLILTSARSAWLETAGQLDIPIVLYDAETPKRLKEAVLLTGQLFGPNASAQAQAWVAYYDSVINRVSDQTAEIPSAEQQRVLFTGTEPLRVASGDMYQTFIIESAGGVSVSAELDGYWNDVNLEQVAIWEPDVIIVPPYGGASVGAITDSEEWQILSAVQAGQVYRMPKLVIPWDTPVPDSVLGVVWMAQRLYPDLVDLDCAAEAEYFYNTYYDYALTAEEIDTICAFE